MSRVGTAAKALLGGATAAVGSLAVAAVDGHITLAEGLTAALAGLVALGGVYIVPNQRRPLPGPGVNTTKGEQ